MRSGAFASLVAAAPGGSELIAMTKLWELVQRRRWNSRAEPYDLVIVDAPASGHGAALLRAPRTFAEIARVGPIGYAGARGRGLPQAGRGLRDRHDARRAAGVRDARSSSSSCPTWT